MSRQRLPMLHPMPRFELGGIGFEQLKRDYRACEKIRGKASSTALASTAEVSFMLLGV